MLHTKEEYARLAEQVWLSEPQREAHDEELKTHINSAETKTKIEEMLNDAAGRRDAMQDRCAWEAEQECIRNLGKAIARRQQSIDLDVRMRELAQKKEHFTE